MGDSRWVFGLDIGFIDHLQVVTTNNYDTITDFHTLSVTQHMLSQSAFTSCFLAAGFNTVTITASLNYTIQISL
jgi:hypothetical protein